jgi:hypothetical protein
MIRGQPEEKAFLFCFFRLELPRCAAAILARLAADSNILFAGRWWSENKVEAGPGQGATARVFVDSHERVLAMTECRAG